MTLNSKQKILLEIRMLSPQERSELLKEVTTTQPKEQEPQRRSSSKDIQQINAKLDQRIREARKTREELGEFLTATEIREENIRGKTYFVVRDPQRKNKIVDKLEKTKGVDKQVAFSRFNKRFKTFDYNVVSIDDIGRISTGETLVKVTTKQHNPKYGKDFQAMYSAAAMIIFSSDARKAYKKLPHKIKTPIFRGFSKKGKSASLPLKRSSAKQNWYAAIIEYLAKRFSKTEVERLKIGSKQSFIITPINPKERTIYYTIK
jgi:hypothetical protein